MDYSKFQNWKNPHATQMRDLTFAKPYDIFIFTRFTSHLPLAFDSRQILYAESTDEVIGYIRHIFLYDILNDIIDDIETDFKTSFDERQKDAISVLNYWFKSGKISVENNSEEIKRFCEKFNSEFSCRKDTEYEIKILNGADELRDFLIEHYSEFENFDKDRLSDICSKELFAGRVLSEFLDMLFK